jgi:hypothetical protein
MFDRVRNDWGMGAGRWAKRARNVRRPAVVFMLCGAIAGCTGMQDNGQLFADPGKYQYHNCEQLATAHKAVLVREAQLKGLIDKAEQGAAGAVVGTIAYRTDYIAVGEELRVIESAERNKNCPPPPATPPSPPAPRRGPAR